jgi:hypothetical protein
MTIASRLHHREPECESAAHQPRATEVVKSEPFTWSSKALGLGIHLKEPHDQQTRDYLFRVLKVTDPMRRTKSIVKGSTANTKSFAVLEIPSPLLSEQVRIVTRIDEFRERLAVRGERLSG